MKTTIKSALAVAAAFGMVSSGPAFAAGATRSAAALPLLAASVGSVPYKTGVENTWRCVSVKDEALKLNDRTVRVDEAGRVVVDPKGVPFDCSQQGTGLHKGGFPFAILLGGLGLGGLIFALAGGGGGNDSAG